MTEEILNSLCVTLCETGNKSFIKLANQLADPKFKEGRRKILIEKKLYSILERCIDQESFKVLEEANKHIAKMNSNLIYDGGWFTSRNGATNLPLEDEYFRKYPNEIREDTRLFHVERDEKGYHLQQIDFEPEEYSIYGIARLTEARFLQEHRIELQILHSAHTIKEEIMSGRYEVKQEYAQLVEQICEYFGYPKTKTLKTVINK